MSLKSSVKDLGITYKINAKKLEKLGVKTVEDLLLHIPFRYENLSLVSLITFLQPGEIITIKGKVLSIKNIFSKSGKKMQIALLEDSSGITQCIWFNQMFILRAIKQGDCLSLAGKVIVFQKKIAVLVSEYEILQDSQTKTIHTGRLVPVYPETRGMSSKWIRNRVKEILESHNNDFEEFLPEEIIKKQKLISLKDAIKQIHFPDNLKIAEEAKKRLAFDELFTVQLSAAYRKKEWKKKTTTYFLKISPFKQQIQKFWDSLSFRLTNAQNKAVEEIFSDLASHQPMNRLLEGDVGSGKTVVATIAMYLAYLNGLQSALMAPTEILANQHYETISNFLSPFGVKVGLVTGSKKLKAANHELRVMNQGEKHNSSFMIRDSEYFDILVGTHALIHEKVKFEKLGLAVIDEQQRFGVEQRTILRNKGKNPHFLTMTATPIPRTIFLTLYGDLDLSYLDEMPEGRKRVKTWLVPKTKREAAYEWIKRRMEEKDLPAGKQVKNESKNQVFIICPFIEESESMQTVKAAIKEYENLKNVIFKNYKLGLLHGKLRACEKQEVLENFRDGKLDMLVATPVVEVGIDIKNATIMLIEAADRFGLAQLHQLRGRVGRGEKQSYCLLFTESSSQKSIERLRCLETTHLGAELAELDLKLRGPGEVYGTIQHGLPSLKIASFSDFELIDETKKEAKKILPELSKHPKLLEKIKSYKAENISPD